jgi:hypothetical protein
MRRFYEQRMASSPGAPPLATRLERYRDMLADVGKLRVRGARRLPGGDAMVLQATGESGQPLTLTLSVEPAPPHRLRGIRVEVGS